MTLTLTVTELPNGEGYAIVQSKSHGLNKGETTIATFCGGNLGKRLVAQIATQLADELMADELLFEPGARVIDAVAQ